MLYNISKFDLQQSRRLYPYIMITPHTLTTHNRKIYQPPTSHTYSHSTRKSSLIDADFCTEIQLHIKRLFYGYTSKCHGMLDQQRIQQFFMDCLGKVYNQNSITLRYFLAGISTVNINTFSYSKLIKFIVDPYFEQMVIQNLKSKGEYHNIRQQNSKINENQFIITMQYFLNIINFPYNNSETQKQIRSVFTVIDRDRDGLVSLEELQTWMREYIGNNVVDLPINIIETTYTEEYEVSLRRICKLVFPQLKSMLIQFDKSSKMSLTAAQIQIFVNRYFPHSTSISISAPYIPQQPQQCLIYTYSQCISIISSILFNPRISLSCMSSQFLSISPNQMHMSKQQFVHRFMFNQLHELRIRPAVYMMEEVYDYLILRQDKYDHHIQAHSHDDVYGGATQGSDLDNSRTVNKNLTMLNYVQFLKDVYERYQKESKL